MGTKRKEKKDEKREKEEEEEERRKSGSKRGRPNLMTLILERRVIASLLPRYKDEKQHDVKMPSNRIPFSLRGSTESHDLQDLSILKKNLIVICLGA